MTREETQYILAVIDATFPNFKVENLTETVNAWHLFLQEYDFNLIQAALKTYISTNSSGFAPSVSQLIRYAQKKNEVQYLNENEAWVLVRQAISNSAYNSEREFARLPDIVQKAVGSPNQLRNWAIDENFNESVISSLFGRTYNTEVKRQQEFNAMPREMKELISKQREAIGCK